MLKKAFLVDLFRVGVLYFLLLNVFSFASEGEGSLLMNNNAGKKKAFKTSGNVVFLEQLPAAGVASDSAIHFRFGVLQFGELELANAYYRFSYPKRLGLTAFGFGLEYLPFRLQGRLGVHVEAGYSFNLSNLQLQETNQAGRVGLHVFPVSASLLYCLDLNPWVRFFSPTLEAGVGDLVFVQSGDVDGTRMRGGSLFYSASVGARISLLALGLENTRLSFDYRRMVSFEKPKLGGRPTYFEASAWSFGLSTAI